MNQTTEMAIIMPDIFNGLDFSKLNKTITALATHNGDLTVQEKEFAVKTIEEWETGIIGELGNKEAEAYTILDVLSTSPRYSGYYDEDFLERMVEATGLQASYQKFLDAKAAYEYLTKNAPQYPVEDLSLTLEESLKQKNDFKLEQAKHKIQASKLERNASVAFSQLKEELNAQDSVKELIKRITKFKRNVSKLKRECTEKSQLAKINVTINSSEIREALAELMNFSISI